MKNIEEFEDEVSQETACEMNVLSFLSEMVRAVNCYSVSML